MLFSGVYDIDNIPLMSDFYSPARHKAIAEYLFQSEDPLPLMRLQRVQKQRLTHELMHAIELAKIQLSDQPETLLTMPFIESSLQVDIQREEVSETMEKWFAKMFIMIDSAIEQANKQPQIIYLTGGMGLSPLVQKAISTHYPNITISVADAFSSVVFGALLKAKRLYA